MNKMIQQGITLIELMIAIGIMAIIVALAAPSFTDTIDRKRLISAAEQIMQHIQLARITSISTERSIQFEIDGSTSTWQYGFGLNQDGLTCDPSQTVVTNASACKVIVDDGDADGVVDDGTGTIDAGDLVLKRYTSDDHSSVIITTDVVIDFDRVRGMATNNAATTDARIELTSSLGKRLDVRVGLLGDARICAPDTSTIEYTGC